MPSSAQAVLHDRATVGYFLGTPSAFQAISQDGTLIAVQNGFAPRRVMRFNLDPTGRRIVRAQPLDAGRKAWGLPTRGTMAGDKYYFIANTQKDQFDRFGLVKDAKALQPVRIWESDARFAWDAQGQVKALFGQVHQGVRKRDVEEDLGLPAALLGLMRLEEEERRRREEEERARAEEEAARAAEDARHAA